MRRIMKRSGRQAKKDQQARTRLGEYEHFPLEMLSDAAVLKFAVTLLSKRPIDAALELAWIVAREDSSYAGSPSSFQEAWRIYQRWLSGKPLPENLAE